jgi:hypothetical protein
VFLLKEAPLVDQASSYVLFPPPPAPRFMLVHPRLTRTGRVLGVVKLIPHRESQGAARTAKSRASATLPTRNASRPSLTPI